MKTEEKHCHGEKLENLVSIMEQLRAPNGCPWDKEQNHDTLKKCLVEETYEVLDAIERRDDASLCDELGDVLLQVVFHAQLGREDGTFNIDDVVDAVSSKMVRRHPHIFGDAHADDSGEVLTMWESIKAQEKKSAVKKRGLMDLNENMPALMMAQKVQDKAHRVGFDWDDISGAEEKLQEELVELKQAGTAEEKLEEFGDVLFALVNIARFMDIDAESALRFSTRKFMNRFRYIEEHMEEAGLKWGEASLSELDQLWDAAKQEGL